MIFKIFNNKLEKMDIRIKFFRMKMEIHTNFLVKQ